MKRFSIFTPTTNRAKTSSVFSIIFLRGFYIAIRFNKNRFTKFTNYFHNKKLHWFDRLSCLEISNANGGYSKLYHKNRPYLSLDKMIIPLFGGVE
jgi:hypothetical protein